MGSAGFGEPVKYPLPLGSLQVPVGSNARLPGQVRCFGRYVTVCHPEASALSRFGWIQIFVGCFHRNPVHARTQRLIRNEVVVCAKDVWAAPIKISDHPASNMATARDLFKRDSDFLNVGFTFSSGELPRYKEQTPALKDGL
jgi:hypothetical protein